MDNCWFSRADKAEIYTSIKKGKVYQGTEEKAYKLEVSEVP